MRSTVSLLLFCLALPASADPGPLADWLYDFFIDGASITPGMGVKQAGLTVKRLADNSEGHIYQRNDQAWFLSYSTKSSYFKSHPSAGYTFVFNLSSFNARQQQISSDTFIDLGTRVKGEFLYVVPTLFYQWGEQRYTGTYLRIGLGLGLGMSRFDGDVYLTDATTPERIQVLDHTTRLDIATSAMVEARWHHWGIIITGAGPVYKNHDYEYQVEDVSISLGYAFVIN